ncbi:MAG: hypothetical protein KJ077_14105 [Anaerolineae bacterium]|nr:hypothetical protein [Anaerolineae bacterium]
MLRRIIISVSGLVLMVGLGIGLLFVPLIAGAASGSTTHTNYNDFTQCTALTGTFPTPLFTHTYVITSPGSPGVRLAAALTDEFNGSVLNSSLWATGVWSSTSYVPTLGGGILTLPAAIADGEGGWVRSTTTYTRAVVEVIAEFTAGRFQHIGFAPDGGLNLSGYYLIFSTNLNDGNLYARANDTGSFVGEEVFNLGPIPTGMHRYRVEWSALNATEDQVTFYIDGLLNAQTPVSNTSLSNFHLYLSNNGTSALRVDQAQVEPPYQSSGSYTSCVVDAGAGNGWQTMSWDATLPAQTGLNVEARTSNNGTAWSSWQAVSNGGVLNNLGRYAQYRLNLTSSNTVTTPVVNAVTLNFNTFPNLSINNATVNEGINAVFTVTLSNPISQTVSVNYATANGTATAPADFTAINTSALTFAPGVTARTVTVSVNEDVLDEENETFFVNLSSATNAIISDNSGQGTINDNDPLPNLSINEVTLPEGNSGTANANFTVSLTPASGKTVTVNYTTDNNTAVAPDDYLTATGALTFTPGITSRTVTVALQGDAIVEPDEIFFVNLSGATNAGIGDNQGAGTLTNDDTAGVTKIESGGSTHVTEEGMADTYQLRLTSQPTASVTITITTDGQTTVTPAQLTFTTGLTSWNTLRTVTVTAVDDEIVDSTSVSLITHTVASTDPTYNKISAPSVLVSVSDNDLKKSLLPVILK